MKLIDQGRIGSFFVIRKLIEGLKNLKKYIDRSNRNITSMSSYYNK